MKYLILILVVLHIAFLSLCIGTTIMSPSQIWAGLSGSGEAIETMIIRDLRLPRTALALIIGAGLAASGAALQDYTRNALSDPGILGFSACAALGAVTALYFGLPRSVMPLTALIGSGMGAGLIVVMSRRQQGANRLILSGVGIGALATAFTGLVMNFAPNPWALSEMIYWLMGSLKNADHTALIVAGGLTAIGLICLSLIGCDLRFLSLGEDTAVTLGVSLTRVQLLLVIGVALCVGSGVAFAGAIGFVGLFIPHIMRRLSGPDPRALIPLSAIAGAGFLCLADIASRLLSGPGTPLYLGIITALIGVPFFLYLALRGPQL